MKLMNFNPYYLIRPLLFRLDAEQAHHMALACLKKGLGPRMKTSGDAILNTQLCGMNFPNPLGLAAGFDKQCEVIQECFDFGFGFVEAGGVVPEPQPGNPRPRLFRVPSAEGIINRFDFNSDGFDACLRRVVAWRDAHTDQKRRVLGINLAKGRVNATAVEAYCLGLKKFAAHVDFATVNVSCPNTPDLRNLQGKDFLSDILRQVMAAWQDLPQKPKIFVKIAPDQTPEQMNDIAETVLSSGIHGMIVGNTTSTRPDIIPPRLAKETGGLSGKPLFDLSTGVLATMYKLTGGKIPLIGCGGVSSGADAYAKIRAGASLVQLYSALIYHGPYLVPRINRDLAALLRRDGFSSVAEAVGKGNG